MDLLWSFLLFSLYFPAYPHFLQRCFRGFTFAPEKYGNGLHNSLFAEQQQSNQNKIKAMKLIIIDRKAWERHHSEFADFIHSIEQLIGNPPETDEWLDNEAVCKRLGISKRTLQSYRDTGKIPFSMIGHKCYYKESDITELLNAKSE